MIRVGDLVAFNPEFTSDDGERIGIVLARDTVAAIPFEGLPDGEDTLLVRWAQGGHDEWLNPHWLTVISAAERKALTNRKK